MPLSKSSVSLKTDTSSKLKGSTQYALTVSAEGYVRNVQKVTLSEDTNMDVVLEKGATVNFNVYQASGKKTTMPQLRLHMLTVQRNIHRFLMNTAMKYCLMKTDTIQLFSVSIVIQSKLTDMILNLQLLTLPIHHLKITIM